MSLEPFLERNNRVRDLLRDAKANGIIYIKSKSVAEELRRADKRLNVTWNEEDRHYVVTYFKGAVSHESARV